jgi:hypothetical protein
MLQVFYMYVAKVDPDVACVCYSFQVFFFGVLQLFQTYICKYFNYFGCMLQVFHLDIAKVDMVLHMLQWDHQPQPPTAVAEAPPSGCKMSPPACA